MTSVRTPLRVVLSSVSFVAIALFDPVVDACDRRAETLSATGAQHLDIIATPVIASAQP